MNSGMQNEKDSIITDLAFSDFGGKNKARRLAKLVAKGKGDSAKAKKLQAKVTAKVDKLAAKGKVDKKRYLFLTAKLEEAGITSLTDAEQTELDGMQTEVEKGDTELQKELSTETGDTGGDTEKSTTDKRFLGMQQTTGIIVTVAGGLLILGTIAFFVFRRKKA